MPPYLELLLSRVHHYHLFIEGDGNPGGGSADPPPAPPPPADKTILGGDPPPADGNNSPPTGDGDPPPLPTLGENWREALAGGDESFLKTLKRFASPETFTKSYREAQNKLRSGPAVPTLPEGATPEEIAAYRKQVGVPDAPDGYGFAFPKELGATESDTAALGEFQTFMHERNVPPGAAKAAFDYYVKRMGEGRAAAEDQAKQATLEAMAELRGEWKGAEYTRNMKIADEFLMRHFGEDPASLEAVNTVLGMRLPNGVQVMHYPAFMKGLVAMARSYADDEALLGGDVGSGGKSIDDEYKALIKKSVTPGQKMTDTEFSRMQELAGARNRREQGSRRVA